MVVTGSARAALLVLFAAAGLAKLLDRPAAVSGLRTFGVGPRVERAWWALPAVELGVAASLLFDASVRVGAAVAVVLLLTFSLLAARLIRRGTTASCHCFGSAHDAPIGRGLLIRNALFGLAGVAVVLGPATHWWTGFGQLPAAGRTGIVIAVVGALAAIAAATGAGAPGRAPSDLSQRLAVLEAEFDRVAPFQTVAAKPSPNPGLPLGAIAPRFSLPGPADSPHDLHDPLAPGRPTLLVFVSGGCGSCEALLPKLAGWTEATSVSIVLLVGGDDAQGRRRLIEPIDGVTTLLDADRAVAMAYEAQWTPGAVLVGGNGRIASRIAFGDAAIPALVDFARSSAGDLGADHVAATPPPAVEASTAPGRPLPHLDRLTGHVLADTTALIFWDPTCGFCQRLAPALRSYVASRASGEPAVLLVSTATDADLGDEVPTFIDEDGELSRAMRVGGTPSGVIVDADGDVRSDVVAGAPRIASLIGERFELSQPVAVPGPTRKPTE